MVTQEPGLVSPRHPTMVAAGGRSGGTAGQPERLPAGLAVLSEEVVHPG
jgi:hypothetical protein